MAGVIAIFAMVVSLLCRPANGNNVASFLAKSFSINDRQLALAEQEIHQISIKYFNERPSHGVQFGMSKTEFTAFVHRLVLDFAIPTDVETSILDGLYAAANREVVREINFSKDDPGFVTYGQVGTLRHDDGRIDLAHTIHHFSFELQSKKGHKHKAGRKHKCRGRRRHKKKKRSLSQHEMDILVNYAKHKAFTNFNSGYANEIAGSCPTKGCAHA